MLFKKYEGLELGLIIFSFAVAFFELFCSRRNQLFEQLSSQFIPIDGDIPQYSNDEDYIYYRTSNMTYSSPKDYLFGFSHQCGVLERNVQYCQWVEVQHTKERKVGNDTIIEYYYTYHKHWTRNQVPSFLFHDPLYHNPSVKSIPEESFYGKTRAGQYAISQSMTLVGSRDYFYPSSSQIRQFEEEGRMPDFKYAGKGIFYSAYERGLFDQILRAAQFFDLKGDLVDWCTPGDRRIWFESWEPTSTTVIGSRIYDRIEPFEFEGYKIGSVHSGDVKLEDAIKANASSFPTIVKWVLRVGIVGYFIWTISEGSPDYIFVAVLALIVAFAKLLPATINSNIFTTIIFSVIGCICSYGAISYNIYKEGKRDEYNNYDYNKAKIY